MYASTAVQTATSLASHAPNTSNLGSGRDQYTDWFCTRHLGRRNESLCWHSNANGD